MAVTTTKRAEISQGERSADAGTSEYRESFHYEIVDTDFVSQILRACAQSLRSTDKLFMSGILNLHSLDGVRVAEGLEVFRYGTPVQGLIMWEALLTQSVQETLLKEIVQSLADRWSSDRAPAIVSPSGGVVVLKTSLNRGSAVGEEDEQLLNSLKKFADLQAKYLQVVVMPTESIAHELSDTVTDALIGYVSGVTDRTVRNWISGKHTVRRGNTLKLRVMLTAVRLLLEVENSKVTQRWFATRNPHLDGNAPADMLLKGEKLDWVIRSAAAYAEEGI